MPINTHTHPFKLLVCPKDRAPLNRSAEALVCDSCGAEYPIRDGLPNFFADAEWNELYLSDGGEHYASAEPFQMLPGDFGYLPLRGDDCYGTILDLGCGDGVFCSKLPENCVAYCVDVTEVGLRRLQRRSMPNLVPVLASGFELPFPDNTFDTVLYIFVVEHLVPEGDLRMLREIRRVLKNDGRLVFTTDTPFFDRHMVRWTSLFLRGRRLRQDHSSPTGHINLLTMSESRQLVARAGFCIEAEHPYHMGTRFGAWMVLVRLLQQLFPAQICEDFLTSKYTFVLSKRDADRIR